MTAGSASTLRSPTVPGCSRPIWSWRRRARRSGTRARPSPGRTTTAGSRCKAAAGSPGAAIDFAGGCRLARGDPSLRRDPVGSAHCPSDPPFARHCRRRARRRPACRRHYRSNPPQDPAQRRPDRRLCGSPARSRARRRAARQIWRRRQNSPGREGIQVVRVVTRHHLLLARLPPATPPPPLPEPPSLPVPGFAGSIVPAPAQFEARLLEGVAGDAGASRPGCRRGVLVCSTVCSGDFIHRPRA
jgi:hypothetical protein